MDWVTPQRVQAAWKVPAVYSLPWSVCIRTPATAGRPPRTAIAICNAASDKSASWCSPRANPTIRRDPMSSTLSR